MTEWFAKASKWRGGSTFAGHVNKIFDAVVDAFTTEQKQAAYEAAPLFAPLTPTSSRPRRRRRGAPPVAVRRAADWRPAGASGRPPPVAVRHRRAGGGAGGGGGGGRGPPALTRNVPLDRQERYDNLVFPRGGGPGSLAGRGGGPNADDRRARCSSDICASCHRFGTVGNDYGPELTTIGQTMPRRDILRSIFFPQEKVDPKYETTVIVTRDKQTIRGLVVSEDAQSVVAEDGRGRRSRHGRESRDLEAHERAGVDHAGRPAGPVGDKAIRDIVAYLMTGTRK